ncbi:hypothetical protein [Streptomyces albus]|uniref:hypothetical protein n=1 Tax=Streptomyces albus TaxID=1888 RepID=UPI001F0A9AD4|nr:hypothetical protein [Streptomyces albus]
MPLAVCLVGAFRLLSEFSVGSSMRRIETLTRHGGLTHTDTERRLLNELAALLGTPPPTPPEPSASACPPSLRPRTNWPGNGPSRSHSRPPSAGPMSCQAARSKAPPSAASRQRASGHTYTTCMPERVVNRFSLSTKDNSPTSPRRSFPDTASCNESAKFSEEELSAKMPMSRIRIRRNSIRMPSWAAEFRSPPGLILINSTAISFTGMAVTYMWSSLRRTSPPYLCRTTSATRSSRVAKVQDGTVSGLPAASRPASNHPAISSSRMLIGSVLPVRALCSGRCCVGAMYSADHPSAR